MALLSADNRLRQRVCAQDGMVLLIGAGFVDKIIRFTQIPSCLKPFMSKDGEESVYPVVLNLDRGPGQEAWKEALRDAQSRARRDKPIPAPLEVSADPKEGWAVDVEDVPVIEYDATAEAPKEAALKCSAEGCGLEFRTENGLRIHKARKKHE